MKSGFDINRIQGDGYLILPLSMSRLATGQTPEACYEVLQVFVKKLESLGSDVVILYTNGLYFNSEEVSFENRKKTTQQVLNHLYSFRSLVERNKEFIPGAIHYLPIDYVLFNASAFKECFDILKKAESENEEFRNLLIGDSRDREYTEANMNFLIEEIAVAHILRHKLVELPRTLVRADEWRLIAYPGSPLAADVYQYRHKLLPQKDSGNPYQGAQYDLSEKALILFAED